MYIIIHVSERASEQTIERLLVELSHRFWMSQRTFG